MLGAGLRRHRLMRSYGYFFSPNGRAIYLHGLPELPVLLQNLFITVIYRKALTFCLPIIWIACCVKRVFGVLHFTFDYANFNDSFRLITWHFYFMHLSCPSIWGHTKTLKNFRGQKGSAVFAVFPDSRWCLIHNYFISCRKSFTFSLQRMYLLERLLEGITDL